MKQDIDFGIIDFNANYRKEMRAICGKFYPDLLKIFPHKLGIYVLLTRPQRRNVWYAYLANKKEELPVEEIRQKLLFSSAKSLLTNAYKDLPTGFLGLIKSPSVSILGAKSFVSLHHLLATGKVNATHLHGHLLTDDQIMLLDALPDQIATIKIAKKFETVRNYDKFTDKLSFIEMVSGKDMRQQAHTALLAGTSPDTTITQLLDEVAFPAPVLAPHTQITHIANAAELFDAARYFENCLCQKLPEALAGTHQFYIYDQEDEKIVFSITKFTSSTWVIDEVQKDNDPFTFIDEIPDLISYLEENEIYRESCTHYKAMKSIMRMQ